MRTVGSYLASMRHAIGKTPSPGHDLWTTFNEAARALFTSRQWEWRTEGPVAVKVIAGQDWLDLPENFGSLLNVWIPNTGTFTSVQVIDREMMGMMRAGSQVTLGGGCLYLCFNANQTARHTPPRPSALLYPTPATTGAPTLQLIYARRWVTVKQTDPDAVVDIPEEFDAALNFGCRALACTIENQLPTIEEMKYQAELQRLETDDSLRQPSEGFVRGGVNSRRSPRIEPNYGLADLNR